MLGREPLWYIRYMKFWKLSKLNSGETLDPVSRLKNNFSIPTRTHNAYDFINVCIKHGQIYHYITHIGSFWSSIYRWAPPLYELLCVCLSVCLSVIPSRVNFPRRNGCRGLKFCVYTQLCLSRWKMVKTTFEVNPPPKKIKKYGT